MTSSRFVLITRAYFAALCCWAVIAASAIADGPPQHRITLNLEDGTTIAIPAAVFLLAPGESITTDPAHGASTQFTRTEDHLEFLLAGESSAKTISADQLEQIAPLAMLSARPSTEATHALPGLHHPIGWQLVDQSLEQLELTTVDDAKWPLAALQGQTVLLSFWATWCVPCLTELEFIQGWLADGGDPQIEIFAVNVGESSEEIKAYVGDHGLDQIPMLKASMSVLREQSDANSISLPQLWLIDGDSRLRRSQSGFVATDADSWIEHVRAAAASIHDEGVQPSPRGDS